MNYIEQNLMQVRALVANACAAVGRDARGVQLLAVSKRHSAESIRAAYACQQQVFGENYLSEALEKQEQLSDLDIEWHFIGHVQSNKTRKIAEHFSWVHAVDSLRVAQRLSDQRPEEMAPINICLQINIDCEESKSGLLPDIDTVREVAAAVSQLPNVRLRGLMCIPAPQETQEQERASFERMRILQDDLIQSGIVLDTLSMGMSSDIAPAIACGSTVVRIGTAIFGVRT